MQLPLYNIIIIIIIMHNYVLPGTGEHSLYIGCLLVQCKRQHVQCTKFNSMIIIIMSPK